MNKKLLLYAAILELVAGVLLLILMESKALGILLFACGALFLAAALTGGKKE